MEKEIVIRSQNVRLEIVGDFQADVIKVKIL